MRKTLWVPLSESSYRLTRRLKAFTSVGWVVVDTYQVFFWDVIVLEKKDDWGTFNYFNS